MLECERGWSKQTCVKVGKGLLHGTFAGKKIGGKYEWMVLMGCWKK